MNLRRFPRAALRSPGVLLVLTLITFILYGGIINSNFLADDFAFIHFLHFDGPQLLDGQAARTWFISMWAPGLQSPGAALFFRPLIQYFFLLDYIVWQLNPFGFHLTNLILHILTAFQLYLLTRTLTRERGTAILAAALFVTQPVHLEAVSWISGRTDVVCGFFYVLSVLCFALYRKRGRWLYYALSVAGFILALSAKEMGFALPLVLLAYETLYGEGNWRTRLRAHLPFWLVALLYLLLRLEIFGQIGGYSGALQIHPVYLATTYLSGLAVPFLSDVPDAVLVILMLLLAVTLIVCRRRREVWFGLGWGALSLLPAVTTPPAPRFMYIPSEGISLFFASALVSIPLSRRFSGWPLKQAAGLLLCAVYCWSAFSANLDWARAAQITETVTRQSGVLRPDVPPGARMIYVGVPAMLRNALVYVNGLSDSIQLEYDNPNLGVYRLSKFPIFSDHLDTTFYFEFRRGRLVARQDVIDALKVRAGCLADSVPSLNWDFQAGAEGWDPWNQISVLGAQAGILSLRVEGSDPNLGGPQIDVPAMSIGDIEIRMRVVSTGAAHARIFWTTSSDHDFLPDKQQTFPLTTDGQFHVYRLPIDQDGNLFWGDHITQLRFDPADAPALVDLDYIRVFTHCQN